MIPQRPKAALVLRYSFLWRHEADQGREEGVKERPVVVIVVLVRNDEVVVAPITTKTPPIGSPALEIPPRIRAQLGLNAERCWISAATLNLFVWPGPDIHPIPGRTPATASYGFIPQKLLDAAKALVMSELSKKSPGLIIRRRSQ